MGQKVSSTGFALAPMRKYVAAVIKEVTVGKHPGQKNCDTDEAFFELRRDRTCSWEQVSLSTFNWNQLYQWLRKTEMLRLILLKPALNHPTKYLI